MISDDVSRLDEMRSQVTEFHNNNPEVWKMFVGFTFEMIMSGRKHYSVNAVFERSRYKARPRQQLQAEQQLQGVLCPSISSDVPRVRWLLQDAQTDIERG